VVAVRIKTTNSTAKKEAINFSGFFVVNSLKLVLSDAKPFAVLS